MDFGRIQRATFGKRLDVESLLCEHGPTCVPRAPDPTSLGETSGGWIESPIE